MLIFIDESGIHKNVDNSTFVLVYVEINNYEVIEKEIEKVEKELNLDYFHWSKTVWKVKEKFMDKILKLDFKVKIAVIKNPVKPNEELERILTHMIIEKNIKNIYLDSKQPRWYDRKIKKILRDKGISIRKFKTVNDKQFAGIRLADMVAGLSRSYFDKKNLDKILIYYKRLQNKIIIILE
ncbi:MAG: DUF3800 domain-containing protein [Patescibacteria group bacterium]